MQVGDIFRYKIDVDGFIGVVLSKPNRVGQYKTQVGHIHAHNRNDGGNMQVGDEVTFKKPHYEGAMKVHNATRFTIVEISDEWLKLKHPEVGGYFVFSMDLVDEVFPKK